MHNSYVGVKDPDAARAGPEPRIAAIDLPPASRGGTAGAVRRGPPPAPAFRPAGHVQREGELADPERPQAAAGMDVRQAGDERLRGQGGTGGPARPADDLVRFGYPRSGNG